MGDKTFLLWLIPLLIVLIIILIIAVINIITKIKNSRKFRDIINLLSKIASDRKISLLSLTLSTDSAYDIYLETKNSIYYIKIVENYANCEICVNNAVKWQMRTSELNGAIKSVLNISKLMTKNIDGINKKYIKKLYIVYPNAHSILKYINECEMDFVRPDTDVYGTNIITYKRILENNNVLDIK